MRVWAAVAAVMLVLALASSTASTDLWTNPQVDSDGEPNDRPPVSTDVPQSEPRSVSSPPNPSGVLDVIGWILMIAVATIAVVAAISAGRHLYWWSPIQRLYRRALPTARMPGPLPPIDETVLEVDVDRAFAALAEGEPRNAIVACWVRLESDASEMGFPRYESETSSEYVARVITTASVDPAPISTLATLYREARFSRHDLDDAARAAATEALHGVVGALRSSAEVTQ